MKISKHGGGMSSEMMIALMLAGIVIIIVLYIYFGLDFNLGFE